VRLRRQACSGQTIMSLKSRGTSMRVAVVVGISSLTIRTRENTMWPTNWIFDEKSDGSKRRYWLYYIGLLTNVCSTDFVRNITVRVENTQTNASKHRTRSTKLFIRKPNITCPHTFPSFGLYLCTSPRRWWCYGRYYYSDCRAVVTIYIPRDYRIYVYKL